MLIKLLKKILNSKPEQSIIINPNPKLVLRSPAESTKNEPYKILEAWIEYNWKDPSNEWIKLSFFTNISNPKRIVYNSLTEFNLLINTLNEKWKEINNTRLANEEIKFNYNLKDKIEEILNSKARRIEKFNKVFFIGRFIREVAWEEKSNSFLWKESISTGLSPSSLSSENMSKKLEKYDEAKEEVISMVRIKETDSSDEINEKLFWGYILEKIISEFKEKVDKGESINNIFFNNIFSQFSEKTLSFEFKKNIWNFFEFLLVDETNIDSCKNYIMEQLSDIEVDAVEWNFSLLNSKSEYRDISIFENDFSEWLRGKNPDDFQETPLYEDTETDKSNSVYPNEETDKFNFFTILPEEPQFAIEI